MNIEIKLTTQNEFFETENLTRETFWNLYSSGCSEHLVLHNLRKSNNYIPKLDLYALKNDKIVGHIISSKAIVKNVNSENEVLCVGPVSVIKSLQGKGIGGLMIKHSINVAHELGYKGMILFGDPNYYKRFGFLDAGTFNIQTKDGLNMEPFMALELSDNSLSNISGKFYEDNSFFTDEAELEEYEKQFPYKEKGEAKIKIEI